METLKYYRKLAHYYTKKPICYNYFDKEYPNISKLVEQPFQQINGQLNEAIKNALIDPEFLEVKCKAYKKEGEVNSDFINKLCLQDNTCVALAGPSYHFWNTIVASKVFRLFK